MAGPLLMDAVRDSGAVLLPIDSEHNAIFQALPRGFDGDLAHARVSPLVADRLGRAVPARAAESAGERDAGAGVRASQMGDGPQDFGRLGDADEQGPGSDRGEFPVQGERLRRSRWSYTRKASSIRWSNTSTVRCLRNWAIPTCARRSPMRWLTRSASIPASSRWTVRDRLACTSSARTWSAFPA